MINDKNILKSIHYHLHDEILSNFFFLKKSPLFKMLTNKITIIVMLSFNIFHIHFLFQKKKNVPYSFIICNSLYIYKIYANFFFFFFKNER